MKDAFWKDTLWIATIALLIGGGAGILATSYTSSYLEDYALELSKLTAPLRLAQTPPKTFPSSVDDALRRFESNNAQSLVAFYPKQLERTFGYQEQDVVATGLVLTTDGWILVPQKPGVDYMTMRVVANETVFDVEQVISDKQTGLVFVKVNANSLSIVGFGSGLNVVTGEQLIASSKATSAQIISVLEKTQPQGIAISSDQLYRTFTIKEPLTQSSFLFSLGGDLVGVTLVDGSNVENLPAESFLPQFRSVLESGEVKRPFLGLQTISLGHTQGMDPAQRRSRTQGAMILDRRSIVSKSPAELAGLKSLDILLSYNGQQINEDQTIDELVARSKVGETVTLRVDRAGEEIDVQVVLAER